MAKTIMGYTPKKLEEKAQKREISVEGLLFYMKQKKRRR